jgi:hypothetical protein
VALHTNFVIYPGTLREIRNVKSAALGRALGPLSLATKRCH